MQSREDSQPERIEVVFIHFWSKLGEEERMKYVVIDSGYCPWVTAGVKLIEV